MTHEQKELRRRELWPLGEVLHNDPVAASIADAYVYGGIATLTEALFQIAIRSSVSRRDQERREIELIRNSGMPPGIGRVIRPD